jgi:hypothetical protein
VSIAEQKGAMDPIGRYGIRSGKLPMKMAGLQRSKRFIQKTIYFEWAIPSAR